MKITVFAKLPNRFLLGGAIAKIRYAWFNTRRGTNLRMEKKREDRKRKGKGT